MEGGTTVGERLLGPMDLGVMRAAVAERGLEGFELEGDNPRIERLCRRCREAVVVIPVGEQDIPAYTDEVGRRHAAIKVPAGLSPLLLAFMRQAICAECIDAEDAELARNRASDDFARRVAKSGLTGAMVKEFSKGWEDIIVRGRSADDGARRREVLAAAQDWAQVVGESARGLWLHGPAGSGKTRLLGTAVVEKLRHTTVRWVNVAVLVMQLDMAWADADRQAALKVLTDPGVVVLDDLDKAVGAGADGVVHGARGARQGGGGDLRVLELEAVGVGGCVLVAVHVAAGEAREPDALPGRGHAVGDGPLTGRTEPASVLRNLRVATRARERQTVAADELESVLVRHARAAGATWEQIADALGIKKQNAWRKYRELV
jgi:hypothetical protein